MLPAPDSLLTVRKQVETDEIILTGRAWVIEGPVSSQAIVTHTAQQTRDAEDNILLVTAGVGDGSMRKRLRQQKRCNSVVLVALLPPALPGLFFGCVSTSVCHR